MRKRARTEKYLDGHSQVPPSSLEKLQVGNLKNSLQVRNIFANTMGMNSEKIKSYIKLVTPQKVLTTAVERFMDWQDRWKEHLLPPPLDSTLQAFKRVLVKLYIDRYFMELMMQTL